MFLCRSVVRRFRSEKAWARAAVCPLFVCAGIYGDLCEFLIKAFDEDFSMRKPFLADARPVGALAIVAQQGFQIERFPSIAVRI